MKPRTLLVLLVLVLGLGSYIWFYDRDQPSSEERAELEKKAIPLKKEDVTAVFLQSDAGTVRLEKVSSPAPKKEKKEGDELALEEPAEWRIVEPLKARADTSLVDGLLGALAALDTVRKLDEVNVKEVGLDKPRATVRVKTAEGEKVLKVGAEIPTSGTTIAALDGEKGALVVSDSFLAEIRRNPGDWRDRQMYRGDRDHVQRITLVSGGQQVVLARQGDSFRIESPIRDRADRDRIDDLFAELSGLTAERFLDGGETVQPATSAATVEVVSDQAPPFRIELGEEVSTPAPTPESAEDENPAAQAKTFQASSGGQRFEVRTRLAEAAARPATDWRAASLSSLESFDVESATVQDGQGALALTRAEPDWKRGNETISYLPVSDLLFSLVGAKADRLLTPDEAVAVGITPNGKPMLTVTLGSKKGQETLKLFAPVAAGTPATASDRNLILLLPPGTLGEIQGKLAEVRKAKPVPAK
ncbi:MAG: DUF4340 domain-containing protein [Acidobacteriota bacterium]